MIRFHLYKSAIVLLVLGLIISVTKNSVCAQSEEGLATVEGVVNNEDGEPLHLAHIMIQGSTKGDVTSKKGRFKLDADTSGTVTIIASMVGYESIEKEIVLHPGATTELSFIMDIKNSSLGEATVTADGFTTGDMEGVTLSPTEVVTTPGAAADIFRALKTFPGVSNIDEGSGLFVRGGDVSEVSFILDQASIVHPYKYENPTGGVFGTIPPFLVSGTYFSTGGFSAKYGNALSAVLAMESKGMPNETELNTNIGLGALSAGGAVSVISKKLGAHFSKKHKR